MTKKVWLSKLKVKGDKQNRNKKGNAAGFYHEKPCFDLKLVVPLYFFRHQTAPYPTPDAKLKIGRYMAITTPPMIAPRKTIMIGSIMLVRALTAVSTSSS